MRRFVMALCSFSIVWFAAISLTAQEAPAEKASEPKPSEQRDKPSEKGEGKGKKGANRPQTTDRNERLILLQRDFEDRIDQAQERIDDLASRLTDLQRKQLELGERYVDELLSFAKEKPSDPAALEALRSIVVDQIDYLSEDTLNESFALLETHHAADPGIGEVCALLGDLETNPALEKFLTAVIAKNPSPSVRSWAIFAQGVHAYTKADETNDSGGFAEAEKLFARAVKEVPADAAEGSPLEVAEKFLFELQNLIPGKPAPDFESEDLNGKKVRLKSLRGKVVVLDFWATWCGFCIDMIPHSREMTKRFADRPFALVGISADDDAGTVTEFMKENPMPWTQWWNGAEGGVVEDWNIQGFPTTYVIDAEGVIRHRNLRGGELEAAVEKLLDEMQAKQGKEAK